MEKMRTVTFLTREQIDFLDKLGKDVLFYQGTKLSRVQILSNLVDLLMAMGVDVKSLDLHKGTLKDQLLKAVHCNGQIIYPGHA